MNKLDKTVGVIFGIFVLLMCHYCVIAQISGMNRIGKEQKLYELSVIWKELSYNFANMDNCTNINLDNLYREYLIITQKTKNDWEYYQVLQRFLAHLNNGHATCYSFPDYFLDYLGLLLFKTKYEDNKVIVENIGAQYANRIHIGDEIVSINNVPVIDYIRKYSIPYLSASNEEVKSIQYAMFGNCFLNYALKDEKIKLGVKTTKGIKKVTLTYDKYLRPFDKDTIEQKRKKYLDTNESEQSKVIQSNFFIEDSVNDFSYIRLTRCDDSFYSYFIENYDKIMQYENLIIDVHNNGGGDGNIVYSVLPYLINNDTIYGYSEKTRVNHALYKAKASSKIFYYEDDEVPNYYKEKMYPYYYNNAFEEIKYGNFLSTVPDSLRYKGKINVLLGLGNGSAGEDFVLMLSQNKNVSFYGKKTVGAFGQPLIVRLPSEIEVLINSTKTYDFQGRDVSSGFPPDFEYDFLEIYRITDSQEMLNKIIEVIKAF